MNYDKTRHAAQKRISEMSHTLAQCGLKLRDEYTLDDAIEFAGKRVLELIDEGYRGMLSLLAAHSHAGRRVSDNIIFVDANTVLTAQSLSMLMRDVFRLASCPLNMDNLSIKYSAVYRPYKKRLIKKSSIFADIEFDIPDSHAKWHIPSAIDENISVIPNITMAHVGDTVINSPSDEWRMTVSSVRLLSHMSESLMRSGAQLNLYFYETGNGCYVIAKSEGDIFDIKSATGLTFFPVPEPDYDDELYEREDEMVESGEMAELTRAEQSEDDTGMGGYVYMSQNGEDELPEIADAPLSPTDDEPLFGDDESIELDPELVEQLGYESESVRINMPVLFDHTLQSLKRVFLSPHARAELREHEYLQVRDQLVQLAQRGLRMNTWCLLREVIRAEGIRPARLKRMGWEGLMWFLCGVDRVDGEIRPYSDDIILYDYRDYTDRRLLVELTACIQRMTRGQMHFGQVIQHNDRNGRPAALEFIQGGKRHKWRLRTDTGSTQLNDYFERMAELMRDNGCSGNLWYFERQSKCYYMYVTPRNGLRLRKLTELPLQPVLREN